MKISTKEQLLKLFGEPLPAITEKKSKELIPEAIEFIKRSPFLLLSTASSKGSITISPKGDEPGFADARDERTIFIPDRSGNKLVDGHQNIIENPNVGLIFFVPNTLETFRVNGKAELIADPILLEEFKARGKPAILITQVKIEESFFHCGKAVIRSNLWNQDSWPEKRRVSFGELFAKKNGKKGLMAKLQTKLIDKAIERDYKKNL
jgi:hypothetical protein